MRQSSVRDIRDLSASIFTLCKIHVTIVKSNDLTTSNCSTITRINVNMSTIPICYSKSLLFLGS